MTKPDEPDDELRLEKQPVESPEDDLPVEEDEAGDVQGGRRPPYMHIDS